MIAYSNQLENEAPADHVDSLMVECCNFDSDGEEVCSFTEGSQLIFPEIACDFLGIALSKYPRRWLGFLVILHHLLLILTIYRHAHLLG